MGACDSNNGKKQKTNKPKNKGKQLFSAPISRTKNDNNMNSSLATTMNSFSQMDIKRFNSGNKNRPSLLYKYKGTYYKKEEQMSIMTATLQDLNGNSLLNNKTENNKTIATNSIYTFIDKTEDDSLSNGFEIISDGKVDEDMVQKSTDRSTIDSYFEYVENKENKEKRNSINSRIYAYKSNNFSNNNKLKAEHYIDKDYLIKC